jgi:hypothetical protein
LQYFVNEKYYSAITSSNGILLRNISSYSLSYPVAMLLTYVGIKLMRGKKLSLLEFTFSLTSLFLFALTLERTPMLAVALSIFLFLIISSIIKHNYLKLFITIAILVGSIYIFNTKIIYLLPSKEFKYTRLAELSNIEKANNMLAREERWGTAIDEIQSINAIWGYGLMYNTEHPTTPLHRGLHSELINQIIEFGFIGLFLLLGFLFFLFQKIFTTRYKIVMLGLYSPIFAFLIIGSVNSPFIIDSVYFFWLFCGYIAIPKNELLASEIKKN